MGAIGAISPHGVIGGSTYKWAVKALGPLGYWRLGEASGTTAVDQMGAYNGTYVNAPTLGAAGLLAGDPTTAAVFTATQSVTTAVLPLASFSVAARVKNIPVAADTYGWIASNGWGGVVGRWGFQLVRYRVAGGSTWYVSLMGYNGATVHSDSATLNLDGLPHLLVGTYDGTTLRVYVDGLPSGTPTVAAFTPDASLSVTLCSGSAAEGQTYQEIPIWDRALTPGQVAMLNAIAKAAW